MEKFITEARYIPVDFDPFTGPAVERAIPTTEAQREVLAAAEMGAEASCAYNESVSLELRGVLDRAALEQAMQALVRRHEALRSTLNASGTRMLIADELHLSLPFKDLAALPDEDRSRQLEVIARTDMTTAFDLRNGPLFRAQLIKVAGDVHLLRLTGHHVVCDGWSLGIMMAEISALYNAAKRGGAPELPGASAFSDYSLATIDFATSPEHAVVERYWLDLYKGSIPRPDLPTDRPRPKRKTYTGDRLDLLLPQDLVRGLKEVATRSGASFVTTLMTTFEVLLHKLTGDSDIVVGLPAAGQSDLGMKHLVGHCVNLLALRSRIDEETPFIEHLRARRTGVLDAFDNQKYTFGTLLRRLNVPREPGRIPLCPVVFNIDMNMDDGVAFDGLTHRFISNPRAFENFELFLNATGNEGHLTLEWSYNTDLFDEATVRGWMDQFVVLIKRVSTAPSASIADLIGDAALVGEQQSPKPEWHGRVTAFPKVDIGSLFDEVAAKHADRTAVELLDQKLSYRELQHRVHALSSALMAMGVKPGEPVGLCMDRSFDMVVAMLATLRAGGCFVPFDPAYPADRLAFMFSDTDVKVMLTQRHLANALPRHGARTILLDDVEAGGDGVALGYWKRDDLTAEKFIDDPFSGKSGAKLYRTGDIVKWQPDGSIAFIGRADGQVKIRGFRIELGEIENALNDLPGVKDKVVVARQDGPGEKQLACYVVPSDAHQGTHDDLLAAVREHLRTKLPTYMVPTGFVVMTELPLTANGKIDRRALPAPAARTSALKAEHVAPRNTIERALATIWGRVLNASDIGIHDDFFDLGGHSLIGIQLLGHVEQQFNRTLPLKSLFEAPTIAQFAELLQGEGSVHDWKNLSLIRPDGTAPPLFCVHGDEASHFLPKYLGDGRPFYAFFHQGEDGKVIRHTSVEAIARFFITELKQARPRGPYLLCGYSFGGIVAYEMAQQLTAMGDEVPYLAVIDAYSPALHAQAIASDLKFWDPIKKALLRALVARFLRNGGTVPERFRNFHIIDTYDRAAMAYVPRPYPGKITVMKAERSWGPKEMGWEGLALGGLEVRMVPGDHYDLIKEPHVSALANELRLTMERATPGPALAL